MSQNASDIQVGDAVDYLPHECHATNRCKATGDYPWVMGLRRVKTDNAVQPPRREEYVEELGDNDLARYFGWLARIHPEAREREKANLVFLRPKHPWKATVAAVNDDGTFDLAVESNQGGVTLNYRNIPHDQAGKTPHSCRKPAKR